MQRSMLQDSLNTSVLFVKEHGHTEELLVIAEHPLREVGVLPAGVSQILCLVKLLLYFIVTPV